MSNVAGAVGRLRLNLLAAGARGAALMVETLTSLVLAASQGKSVRRRAAVESLVERRTRSFPIMISFLVGVIIAPLFGAKTAEEPKGDNP